MKENTSSITNVNPAANISIGMESNALVRQATIKLKVGAENVILIQPTMEMIVFATLDSSEIEINA